MLMNDKFEQATYIIYATLATVECLNCRIVRRRNDKANTKCETLAK